MTEVKETEIKGNVAMLFEHRWRFLALFLGVFLVTFSVFSFIGFIPERSTDSIAIASSVIPTVSTVEVTGHIVEVKSHDPLHITVPAVGIDVNVENPSSRDITVLDTALSYGAVHYPGTGSLTQDANIFIFGHSSFLPNVINKNYQAFNGLKKLKGGEEIFVDSADTRYVYRVDNITLATAEEIQVDLSRGARKLTLSTCNSFGTESERYVVEAGFVGSYLLAI